MRDRPVFVVERRKLPKPNPGPAAKGTCCSRRRQPATSYTHQRYLMRDRGLTCWPLSRDVHFRCRSPANPAGDLIPHRRRRTTMHLGCGRDGPPGRTPTRSDLMTRDARESNRSFYVIVRRRSSLAVRGIAACSGADRSSSSLTGVAGNRPCPPRKSSRSCGSTLDLRPRCSTACRTMIARIAPLPVNAFHPRTLVHSEARYKQSSTRRDADKPCPRRFATRTNTLKRSPRPVDRRRQSVRRSLRSRASSGVASPCRRTTFGQQRDGIAVEISIVDPSFAATDVLIEAAAATRPAQPNADFVTEPGTRASVGPNRPGTRPR